MYRHSNSWEFFFFVNGNYFIQGFISKFLCHLCSKQTLLRIWRKQLRTLSNTPPTDTRENSFSEEHSYSKDIHRLLWYQNVHCLASATIMIQTNQIHATQIYLRKIHFNIIIPHTPRPFEVVYSSQDFQPLKAFCKKEIEGILSNLRSFGKKNQNNVWSLWVKAALENCINY